MPKPLRYWVLTLPNSLDPLHSDLSHNMQAAKNIYAPLVSSFLDGTPQGMIAESWRVDRSGKTWRFKIRGGLIFEDGSPITATAVLLNMRRVLWHTRNDQSALNVLLPGIRSRRRYEDPLDGLRVESDSIVFTFTRRPRNLIETIEQPLYAIANPKCFDAAGRWKDPYCRGESGEYRIRSISPEKVVLQSRRVYPRAESAPQEVEIFAAPDADRFVEALTAGGGDVALALRFAISRKTVAFLADKRISLHEAAPTSMLFVELNAARPPFKDKRLRQSIRDAFHALLGNDERFTREAAFDPSFIPRGGVGYRSFPAAKIPRPKTERRASVSVVLSPLTRFLTEDDRKIQAAIEERLLEALRLNGLEPEVSRHPDRAAVYKRVTAGDFDVVVRGSGLLVADPYSDLRLMFMSKSGALIPDPSGKIPALIKKAEESASPAERLRLAKRINETVYDDASVITFVHTGLAYLHSAAADLSRVSLFADPVEFRAIGWRPR